MKKFLSNVTKFTNIRVYFAPIVLFVGGILCISQSIDAQSASDSFMPNPNEGISAVVVQPDGKTIIGGGFTNVQGVPRSYLVRLNIDGTLDNGFNPNPNGYVLALAIQPDGKIIAGGSFTSVSPNGGAAVTRQGIARFDSDGTLDASFDPNPDNTVFSIAVQPNGKIVTGGIFTGVAPNGGAAITRNRIARFNTDGTLDTSFDPNVNYDIFAVAIHTDGRIIIVGNFNYIQPNGGTGYVRQSIARLNADGTLDTTFDLSLNGAALTAAVQADGKIIAGGSFTSILAGGTTAATRSRIARFNADGTLDASFDPNVYGTVNSVAIQPDGKILAGGSFSSVAPNGGAAVTRNSLARINLDGTLDTAFNPNVSGEIFSLAVQSDDKIFIGGDFDFVGGVPRSNFMRLEKGGLPDLMLNQSTNNVVITTALQTDGKILVGGDFTNIGGVTRNRLARLNADSTLDFTFNPNVNGAVYAICAQTDGKIIIGGDFTAVGGATRNRIARLNANGTLDTSFNPPMNNGVRAITVQPDGKILVGGLFTSISGLPRNYIARLNANGTPDFPFNPNAANNVYTITVQPNGKILVGGDFTSIAGSGQKYIARLNADGTADYSFYLNANGGISSLALQSDGKIIIGGSFTAVGGATRNRITRLNADGSLDWYFNAGLNAVPASIAVQSDGFIIVGGSFTAVNTSPRSYIARLSFSGALDTSFNASANAAVRTLALQPDGKILVGGSFTNIGGQSRGNFARLTNTAAALSTLNISPTTLLLTRDGAAAQFSSLIFEQSLDNGASWTTLGTAASSLTSQIVNDRNDAGANPQAFTSCGYILTGQNIPTGQNVLIRARGFYKTGEKNGSEIVEDKVQNVFLPAPAAGIVSIGGNVVTPDYSGLRNTLVQVQFANGDSVTTRTNALGYFRFDRIAAGQTVIVSVTAKNFNFSPQTVNVSGNITNMLFTSN